MEISGILSLVLQSLYFLLPAYLANCSPLFVKNMLKSIAIPADFGRKFRGRQIFGPHKTIRGLLVACAVGILIFLLQVWLFNFDAFQRISLVNYWLFFQRYNVLPGFLLGFGAIFGDMIKSFFKRQFDVKPGAKWFPWDQIDFLIGAMLFILIIYRPSWQVLLILLISTPLIHISANYIGYYLKIKEVKW